MSILITILIYLTIGILIVRPWEGSTSFFPMEYIYPWLIAFWLPITILRLPVYVKEKGIVGFLKDVGKKTLLHLWLPLIIYYKLKDMKDDKPLKQFEKEIRFKSKFGMYLFEKVQSVKDELGYIYWNTVCETEAGDGIFLLHCQMCQRIN